MGKLFCGHDPYALPIFGRSISEHIAFFDVLRGGGIKVVDTGKITSKGLEDSFKSSCIRDSVLYLKRVK